jgi:hypothetical protein
MPAKRLNCLSRGELGVMAVQNSRHVGGSKRCNRCIGKNLHSGGRSRPSRRTSVISAALLALPTVQMSPSSATLSSSRHSPPRQFRSFINNDAGAFGARNPIALRLGGSFPYSRQKSPKTPFAQKTREDTSRVPSAAKTAEPTAMHMQQIREQYRAGNKDKRNKNERTAHRLFAFPTTWRFNHPLVRQSIWVA